MKTPMKTPNTNTRTPNWYEDCHYKDFVFVMRVVIMGRHVLALISNKKKIVNTQNGKFIGGRGGCSPHQMWFYAGSENGWFLGFFGGLSWPKASTWFSANTRKKYHIIIPVPKWKNTMIFCTAKLFCLRIYKRSKFILSLNFIKHWKNM